jgi:hypothetical protein
MKRCFTLILSLFSLTVYSQNFHLNAGGAFALFPDINSKPVLFSGYGINYTYYLFKRTGFYLGFNHYLPVTYYGELPYSASDNGTIPVYITGAANSFEWGVKVKVIKPESKKIEVNAILAESIFTHKGSYNNDPFTKISQEGSLIHNVIPSFYLGAEMIFKAGSLPLFISGGYVNGERKPYGGFGEYSVKFSSSLVVKAGISLPIMRGPVPSDIKLIKY